MAYQQYPGQQNQQYYAPVQQTNGMAIAALVAALLFAPLGIIFGHIARAQIRRTGEAGSGLALAGLIIGYLFTIGAIVLTVIMVILFVVVANDIHDHMPSTITDTPTSYYFPGTTP
jgi:peptidyl-prolyl cis-trans isomerase B (cyclophilin B)